MQSPCLVAVRYLVVGNRQVSSRIVRFGSAIESLKILVVRGLEEPPLMRAETPVAAIFNPKQPMAGRSIGS
jgi:hypothetical protein